MERFWLAFRCKELYLQKAQALKDGMQKQRLDMMRWLVKKKSNVGFSAANSACQLENPGVTESEREADVLLATLFMLKLNHGMMAVE